MGQLFLAIGVRLPPDPGKKRIVRIENLCGSRQSFPWEECNPWGQVQRIMQREYMR